MDYWELVKLAWQGITANKMRSSLTVLGIIIGIAAVISLLAIAQGAKAETDKQIQTLGSNVLFVRAGAANIGHVALGLGSAVTLTYEDAQAIGKVCPAVEKVAPGLSGGFQAQYANKNVNTTIYATVPDYPDVRNFFVERGRFFSDLDMQNNNKVCVLGTTVASNLFGDSEPIGQNVLIRGENFKVIGIMESKGVSAFTDMDDQIFVPITTAFDRIFGLNPATGRTVRFILVKARDQDNILPAQFQITNLLRLRHNIKAPMEDDFLIRTQQEILQTAQSVTDVFTLLLGSTASISLLVGGIGIMNIMLVSVTERTREIGIRKAVGATQKDILRQFIIEATVLSIAGGITGITLGCVVSHIISIMANWTTVVTLWSIVLAAGVSIFVGLFFGIYPAMKAAKLDPIIALRSE
jgi:putative ABC transport system permease protein